MNPDTDCCTILLVEDYAPLLRNMAFLLEIAGYRVLTATDGLMALEILHQQTPNVIISDIDMPGMDGYDFLTEVRATPEWETLPFIFISAKYELDDFLYALDLGADEYIPKPCDIVDILDALERLRWQRQIEPDREELRPTA